ncbi:hypothetical protein LOY55_11605 [Pseudomonas sp. B21-040]|jgi:hypothetical protein|uniref:hypothetical protein n=1 Tax=unclassified Pseudomonas TaxID=196821 RepID=UPI001CBBA51B|nr:MULTISPECIES: hypothetical protein [unclassified Pseudomonas]UVL42696.1 hypothetical protein LOY55_11605 [Pseudomonas sp. B21-040]
MTKKYEAMVLAIGRVVEEEVLLLVKGLEVKCFASYCPSKIEVGETYQVEFELVLPDNDVVAAAEEPLPTLIEMIGNGFSCALYGYLDGSVFRSFVDFSDQDIHYDHPHLNGQFVKIQVDRIDVSF